MSETSKMLLQNVHDVLQMAGDCILTQGTYDFYHYGCENLDDRGWGCGYRTLQTLCSWVKYRSSNSSHIVPTLDQIQTALYEMEDKPKSIIGSKQWIGSVEVGLCVDFFTDVPCKIIHIRSGTELKDYIKTIAQHFRDIGSPIMMGGDTDASSKGIVGVQKIESNPELLIIDPHYYGEPPTPNILQEEGYVSWRALDTFMDNSFYNLCLPQFKNR